MKDRSSVSVAALAVALLAEQVDSFNIPRPQATTTSLFFKRPDDPFGNMIIVQDGKRSSARVMYDLKTRTVATAQHMTESSLEPQEPSVDLFHHVSHTNEQFAGPAVDAYLNQNTNVDNVVQAAQNYVASEPVVYQFTNGIDASMSTTSTPAYSGYSDNLELFASNSVPDAMNAYTANMDLSVSSAASIPNDLVERIQHLSSTQLSANTQAAEDYLNNLASHAESWTSLEKDIVGSVIKPASKVTDFASQSVAQISNSATI